MSLRPKTWKESVSDFVRDRKKVCIYLTAVSAFVFGLLIPGRVVVAVSPSLDHRIFVITKKFSPGEIKKDDYVIFTVRSHYIKKGKPARLMKKVSCVSGQRLETRSRIYYCNDEYLGMAKWYSLRGEPVDSFTWSGSIPEGKLFVTGQSPDSFDSRYLGFIERSKIEGIAHPLF